MMLQMEKAEVVNGRNKWAQESTKTEGIKRECLQVKACPANRLALANWPFFAALSPRPAIAHHQRL